MSVLSVTHSLVKCLQALPWFFSLPPLPVFCLYQLQAGWWVCLLPSSWPPAPAHIPSSTVSPASYCGLISSAENLCHLKRTLHILIQHEKYNVHSIVLCKDHGQLFPPGNFENDRHSFPLNFTTCTIVRPNCINALRNVWCAFAYMFIVLMNIGESDLELSIYFT